MKTKTLALVFSALTFISSAFAGTAYVDRSKTAVTQTAVDECPCFAPGLSLGIYGGGFFPRDHRSGYDNAAGGGILAEYYFTEMLGIQASYGAFATSGTEHLFNGDVILRFPIHSLCLAPYIMAGGGGDVDGEKLGEWHAGAGIDVRFRSWNCAGIFADGTYNWHNESDRDYTLVRVGLKFHL